MTTAATVTVGVEEEFHLAEPAERALAPAAERVLEIAAALGGELAAEFQRSEVETATPACRTLDELVAQLADRHRGLLAAADRAGVGVVAAGTLPGPLVGGQSPYPGQRYEWLFAEYADVARGQLVCALQVQVGVADRELAVAALPRVAPWLPVLLALSTSSPFFAGPDTGYASYRSGAAVPRAAPTRTNRAGTGPDSAEGRRRAPTLRASPQFRPSGTVRGPERANRVPIG